MIDQDTRDRIIAEPETLLEDGDVMNALIAANERAMGSNIVDLRGIAMERLEARLDRLEDTHRTVIAAAYENLAGTNQVHRAILQLLDPLSFEDFLQGAERRGRPTLRVDCVRLVLESVQGEAEAALRRLGDVLYVAETGLCRRLSVGRARTCRCGRWCCGRCSPSSDVLYGDKAGWIRSEALMKLDFGKGRLPGMLVLGAEDPHQFKSDARHRSAGVLCGRVRTDDAPLAVVTRAADLARAARCAGALAGPSARAGRRRRTTRSRPMPPMCTGFWGFWRRTGGRSRASSALAAPAADRPAGLDGGGTGARCVGAQPWRASLSAVKGFIGWLAEREGVRCLDRPVGARAEIPAQAAAPADRGCRGGDDRHGGRSGGARTGSRRGTGRW